MAEETIHAVPESQAVPYLPEAGSVTVFSAHWCGYCSRLKQMLKHEGIPYREVLIEEDPDAEQLASDVNGGSWTIPTVLYSDGGAQVNPGVRAVQQQLARIEQQR